MSIPNATHQVASNSVAALGNWISLHTSAAGTTGANEASGSPYQRIQSTPWTPNGSGTNTGPQVFIPCPAGTYQEGGIWSVQVGTSLIAPTSLSATGSTSGGTFAAGTFYWVVTATNWQGETTISNEANATLTGSTSSVGLAWSLPVGATGIKVYRGTAASAENVLVATLGAVTSYTDTGSAGVAATPPSSNSTSTFVGSNSFTGGSVTVSGSGASINVTPSIVA